MPREAGSLVADGSQVLRHICEVKSTSPGITGTEDGVRGLWRGLPTSCHTPLLPSLHQPLHQWDFQLSLHWHLLCGRREACTFGSGEGQGFPPSPNCSSK